MPFQINYDFGANMPAGLEFLGWALFVVWVLTLGFLLSRTDLDPVTKLMWVLVVGFIPVVGMVLYYLVAPRESRVKQPTPGRPGSDLYGTPWAEDPDHQLQKKKQDQY